MKTFFFNVARITKKGTPKGSFFEFLWVALALNVIARAHDIAARQ